MTSHDERVDRYLARLPDDQRQLLQALRDLIVRLAPAAEETIAYAMPAFRLGGRFLVSYAGWKRHATIYPVDDALLARHAGAIEGHDRTRGSLHFGVDAPLPDELVEDWVRSRVAAVRAGQG